MLLLLYKIIASRLDLPKIRINEGTQLNFCLNTNSKRGWGMKKMEISIPKYEHKIFYLYGKYVSFNNFKFQNYVVEHTHNLRKSI